MQCQSMIGCRIHTCMLNFYFNFVILIEVCDSNTWQLEDICIFFRRWEKVWIGFNDRDVEACKFVCLYFYSNFTN